MDTRKANTGSDNNITMYLTTLSLYVTTSNFFFSLPN
jgi:hypothetical protein